MRNFLQTLWFVELWLRNVLRVWTDVVISADGLLVITVRWRKLKRHLGIHRLVSSRAHALAFVLLRQDLNHPGKFSAQVRIFTIVRVDKQSVAVAIFRL